MYKPNIGIINDRNKLSNSNEFIFFSLQPIFGLKESSNQIWNEAIQIQWIFRSGIPLEDKTFLISTQRNPPLWLEWHDQRILEDSFEWMNSFLWDLLRVSLFSEQSKMHHFVDSSGLIESLKRKYFLLWTKFLETSKCFKYCYIIEFLSTQFAFETTQERKKQIPGESNEQNCLNFESS